MKKTANGFIKNCQMCFFTKKCEKSVMQGCNMTINHYLCKLSTIQIVNNRTIYGKKKRITNVETGTS